MKTILLLFDSLNRRSLSCYGCDWIKTPAFERLSRHCITFENCYAASLPCMPARRDFQTGRINFLHRSWGPMEPYDNSVTSILRENQIYTHLISDHIHYWEEGGGNYHTKYDSWELVRGQEGDKWQPVLEDIDVSGELGRKDEYRVQDVVNRTYIKEKNEYPIEQVFGRAEAFIKKNKNRDNWFLQIESFDPHEPFFAQQRFRDLYVKPDDPIDFDWPDYQKVKEEPEQVRHCQLEYAALVSACDWYLGKILDIMDRENLWKDTMLIVTTDHGYLLGEHNWWAKTVQPVYNEVAHIPLFLWNPKDGACNERSGQLAQITDLAPTILHTWGIEIPKEMTGTILGRKKDASTNCVKEKTACLFGIHGCYLNVTDGRYVYMKRPCRQDGLYNYTLMPNHMKEAFSKEEFLSMEIHPPFSFTKGYPQLKLDAEPWAGINFDEYGDLLFDLEQDPGQNKPFHDEEIEAGMMKLMVQIMRENDAPKEAYVYWGLEEWEERYEAKYIAADGRSVSGRLSGMRGE